MFSSACNYRNTYISGDREYGTAMESCHYVTHSRGRSPGFYDIGCDIETPACDQSKEGVTSVYYAAQYKIVTTAQRGFLGIVGCGGSEHEMTMDRDENGITWDQQNDNERIYGATVTATCKKERKDFSGGGRRRTS